VETPEGWYSGEVSCNHRKGPNRLREYQCMKCHKRHGRGALRLPNGMIFYGTWNSDSYSGVGKITAPDGMCFEGKLHSLKPRGLVLLNARSPGGDDGLEQRPAWSANYSPILQVDQPLEPPEVKKSPKRSSPASPAPTSPAPTSPDYGMGSYGKGFPSPVTDVCSKDRLSSLASPTRDYAHSPPPLAVRDFEKLGKTAGPNNKLLRTRVLSPGAIKLGTRSMPDTLPSYCQPATTGQIPGHPGSITGCSAPPDETRILQRKTLRTPISNGFAQQWVPWDGEAHKLYIPQLLGVYSGELHGGLPQGKGSCEYDSGLYYEGEWDKGQQHGQGRLTQLSGEIDEGTFVNGRFKHMPVQGYGEHTWPNGGTFAGEWSASRPWEGQMAGVPFGQPSGKYTFEYTGEIKKGKRHDTNGTAVFADGKQYMGSFTADECTGLGVMRYPNNGSFEGEWKAGLPLRGTADNMILQNKDVYTGEWAANLPNGRGTLRYADGHGSFEGVFFNGKPEKGVLIGPSKLADKRGNTRPLPTST